MTTKTTSTTATTTHAPTTRRTSKVRAVPVAAMRNAPVFVTQRPFNRAQAEGYAADFDIEKFGIPVVNHRDGTYLILDGQHRIAALKIWFGASDPGTIDCEVYEGLTDKEAARIFLGRDRRKPVSVFAKFFVSCTAEYPRECEIRRTVEAQHLKVSQSKDPNCVAAVSALGAVYDRAGATVLGQVLRTVRDAYDGDAGAFDPQLIQGLGLVFNRYNGKTQEKELVDRLAHVQHGVRGIMQRAEVARQKLGTPKLHCVAATIVDLYNKGIKSPSHRLPSWWKTNDGCES